MPYFKLSGTPTAPLPTCFPLHTELLTKAKEKSSVPTGVDRSDIEYTIKPGRQGVAP